MLWQVSCAPLRASGHPRYTSLFGVAQSSQRHIRGQSHTPSVPELMLQEAILHLLARTISGQEYCCCCCCFCLGTGSGVGVGVGTGSGNFGSASLGGYAGHSGHTGHTGHTTLAAACATSKPTADHAGRTEALSTHTTTAHRVRRRGRFLSPANPSTHHVRRNGGTYVTTQVRTHVRPSDVH